MDFTKLTPDKQPLTILENLIAWHGVEKTLQAYDCWLYHEDHSYYTTHGVRVQTAEELAKEVADIIDVDRPYFVNDESSIETELMKFYQEWLPETDERVNILIKALEKQLDYLPDVPEANPTKQEIKEALRKVSHPKVQKLTGQKKEFVQQVEETAGRILDDNLTVDNTMLEGDHFEQWEELIINLAKEFKSLRMLGN